MSKEIPEKEHNFCVSKEILADPWLNASAVEYAPVQERDQPIPRGMETQKISTTKSEFRELPPNAIVPPKPTSDNDITDESEEEEEDDFETIECDAPPNEIVEKYGDEMKNDKERELVTIREMTAEQVSENEKKSKRMKWKSAFITDLAHGVPLVSLQEDVSTIRAQNFVCVSIIYGDSYDTLHCGDRVYRGDLIKIRGVFKMRENAAAHSQKLLALDPHTKIVIMKCFTWNLMSDIVDDDESHADKLNNIDSVLRGYFENENSRISSIQRRINMVKSKKKGRAKETFEFHEKSMEQKEDTDKRNASARSFYIGNKKDAISLDQVLDDLEKGNILSKPIIELQADDDSFRLNDQHFACVSYIQPHEYKSTTYPNANFTRPLIKIRGIFPTQQMAEDHIMNKILPTDRAIDVSVVPCWRWAGLEDDAVADRHYMDGLENDDLRKTIQDYCANKNNVITDPKQRLQDAKNMQLEYARRGITNPARLPHDVAILPPLTENQIQALSTVKVLDPSNIDYDKLREVVSAAAEQQQLPQRVFQQIGDAEENIDETNIMKEKNDNKEIKNTVTFMGAKLNQKH